MAGTLLVEEGTGGNSPMYIIWQGAAEVLIAGEPVGQVQEMELLGESHVLDADINTASIRLSQDSIVLLIDKDKFYELLSKNHQMISGIMQIMHKKFNQEQGKPAAEEVLV